MAKTATKEHDKFEHAKQNAKGWYESIGEMLERQGKGEESAHDEISESPLSVLVRDGWHEPGKAPDDGAEEYEILLSTGGPALRIYGTLDQYNQPKTAELQMQDWFLPWTKYDEADEALLLQFASYFWFGE